MNQMQEAFSRLNWNKPPAQREETVPAKKVRPHKKGYRKERYSAEFKQRAVDRVKEVGSVTHVAEELNLHRPTLHQWVYIVEHGGKLEASKGWVPENGDRYLNPNPGHGSDTPGTDHEDRNLKMGLTDERINPIYKQRGDDKMETKYEGGAELQAIGSGAVTGPVLGGESEYGSIVREYEAQRREAEKPARREGFPLGVEVPQTPNVLELRKLRAENEALRQIIRGYQNLLNLT